MDNNLNADESSFEEMGYLFNSLYGLKICMNKGINTITTENLKLIPELNYFQDNSQIIFKLNIQSEIRATLRSYDQFPLLLKIRRSEEEVIVDRSGIYILNNLENLEIQLLFTKNKINLGSFIFHTIDFKEEVTGLEQGISRPIDNNSIEVINLISENEIKQESENLRVLETKVLGQQREILNLNINENLNFGGDLESNFTQNKNFINGEKVFISDDYNYVIIPKNILDPSFLYNFKRGKKINNKIENYLPTIRHSKKIIGKRGRDGKLKNSYDTTDYESNLKNVKASHQCGQVKKNNSPGNNSNLRNLNNSISFFNKKNLNLIKKDTQPHSPTDSNICMICLDTLTLPSQVTGCGHFFCKKCIDKWTSVSNSCPLCKKDYRKIIYYNFNKTKILKQRNVKKKLFKLEEDIEESYIENTLEHCMKCKGTSDVFVMLVCDKCKFNICHTYCAGLDRIPDEDWYCFECEKKKEVKKYNNKQKENVKNEIKTKHALNTSIKTRLRSISRK